MLSKAPTCTEKGEEKRTCKNCEHYETRYVAAKGHTEVIDPAKAPTCTETGLTEGKHCSVCSTVIIGQQILAAKGHTEVINPAVEPTYDSEGKTEGKHCSECGEILVAQKPVGKLTRPTDTYKPTDTDKPTDTNRPTDTDGPTDTDKPDGSTTDPAGEGESCTSCSGSVTGVALLALIIGFTGFIIVRKKY